jgi:Kef-type K+ transport system membrane component KefB
VPRVTLLLCCGLVAGALRLLPEGLEKLEDTITVTALTFVSFLLGGTLKLESLKAHGKEIIVILIAIVLTTLGIVVLGLVLLRVDFGLALILASIATATVPAATLDVVRQSGVRNEFTRVLQGIMAIDDAWGLLVFSLCLALATQLDGNAGAAPVSALHEIGGAMLLGMAIGIPAAFLTGRIDAGEPLQIEALAIAFLTAGLAAWLEVSFLIAGMVVGAIIVNFAAHHRRAFHEIEHIQWPFMILFFILAGAALDLSAIAELGALGLAFITLRVLSRLAGGWMGAGLAGVAPQVRPLYGPALLPQAGVAIGMALLAGQVLPAWQDQILVLTLGATVIFELIGPLCTMWAITKSARFDTGQPMPEAPPRVDEDGLG